MTEAGYSPDENTGSSHDADVDAGYDDDSPASEHAEGSTDVVDATPTESDVVEGTATDSHAADIDAGFDDRDA